MGGQNRRQHTFIAPLWWVVVKLINLWQHLGFIYHVNECLIFLYQSLEVDLNLLVNDNFKLA